QQEAQHVELSGGAHKHHCRSNDAPANHDPGDPAPGSNTVQYEVARHFKQAISEKEDTGAEAECGRAELESIIHLQCGKSDIHAVEPRDDVKHKQEWNEALRNPANCAFFSRVDAGHAPLPLRIDFLFYGPGSGARSIDTRGWVGPALPART